MDKKIIIFIVVVVLLVYFFWMFNSITSSLMYGMWVCDPEFCKESGIESMYLMMNKNKACIVMSMDNKVVHDETFDISFWKWPLLKYTTRIRLYVDDDSILPKSVTAKIDLRKGTMIWKDDDVEYARFVRTFT